MSEEISSTIPNNTNLLFIVFCLVSVHVDNRGGCFCHVRNVFRLSDNVFFEAQVRLSFPPDEYNGSRILQSLSRCRNGNTCADFLFSHKTDVFSKQSTDEILWI
jgi:hypothetical protein